MGASEDFGVLGKGSSRSLNSKCNDFGINSKCYHFVRISFWLNNNMVKFVKSILSFN